jgi:hypothetical protein
MQRNPSNRLSGAARPSHRQSGEYRGRTSFGANGDTAVGVAQIPTPFPNGQARPNGMMGGSQQFDLARSPPSTANKSNSSFESFTYPTDSFCAAQTPNTCHASSSGKAPVKLDKRAHSFTQPIQQLKLLPANISRRCVRTRGALRHWGTADRK